MKGLELEFHVRICTRSQRISEKQDLSNIYHTWIAAQQQLKKIP